MAIPIPLVNGRVSGLAYNCPDGAECMPRLEVLVGLGYGIVASFMTALAVFIGRTPWGAPRVENADLDARPVVPRASEGIVSVATMADPLLAVANEGAQVPAWMLFATAALAPIGVVLGAAITPLSERLTRRDALKSYKRNIYRNYLDHAYWYRRLPDGEERTKRDVKYVADWHRIQLITDDRGVLDAIEDLKDAGSLTEAKEPAVLAAFKSEIGSKGLSGD